MPGKARDFSSRTAVRQRLVPGDKSISHRALIAGACCRKPFRITHLNPGRDVQATREALAALGIQIDTDGSRSRRYRGPLALARVDARLHELRLDGQDAPRGLRRRSNSALASMETIRCGHARWSRSPRSCGLSERRSILRTGISRSNFSERPKLRRGISFF